MRQERLFDLLLVALAVAASAVLFTLKVFEMPQGGAVTLNMLPIIVVALWRGPGVGVTAGVLYGLIELLVLGGLKWVVHPVQLVLDYPLAYGVLGLAGIFSAVWVASVQAGETGRGIRMAVVPGLLVAAAARYACHVVSGVVFFSAYADGQPVVLYSLAYNSFVIVGAALSAVVLVVLMPALARGVPRLAAGRQA